MKPHSETHITANTGKKNIMKTDPYNFGPLKPHFYIVKLAFTGLYFFLISAQKYRLWVLLCSKIGVYRVILFFLFLLQNIDCGYFYVVKLAFTGLYFFLISAQNHRLWVLVRTASPGGSNEYPQSMFLSRNMKNIRIFI